MCLRVFGFCYLRYQLPLMPCSMKYSDISILVCMKSKKNCLMNTRAVVNSSVYFYFLKLLLKRRQRIFHKFVEFYDIVLSCNIKHGDVACNLLAWWFHRYEQTKMVLQLSNISGQIMNSQDVFILKDKSKHFPSNDSRLFCTTRGLQLTHHASGSASSVLIVLQILKNVADAKLPRFVQNNVKK